MSLIVCLNCGNIYDNYKTEKCTVCNSFRYRPIDVDIDREELQGEDRIV